MPATPPNFVLGESGVVFRDKFVDEKMIIEFEVSGDLNEKADSEDAMPTSALLVATITEMFSDGSLFAEMHKRFGSEVTVEIKDAK